MNLKKEQQLAEKKGDFFKKKHYEKLLITKNFCNRCLN